jgi:hypothetical protein
MFDNSLLSISIPIEQDCDFGYRAGVKLGLTSFVALGAALVVSPGPSCSSTS